MHQSNVFVVPQPPPWGKKNRCQVAWVHLELFVVDVFLPIHPWLSECTVLQRHWMLHKDQGLGKAVDLQGFYRTSLCRSSSPAVHQAASLSSAEVFHIHWKESRSREVLQSSKAWLDPALLKLGLPLEMWSIFLIEARTSVWCLSFPWSQPAPYPSQTMDAFVIHSQALCPTSAWREGLYSTCCKHGPNGDFPLCVSSNQARHFLLFSSFTLWLCEGLQTIAMKEQHQLAWERSQELTVKKKNKRINLLWLESVCFLLSWSNHKWENPSHSSLLFISITFANVWRHGF